MTVSTLPRPARVLLALLAVFTVLTVAAVVLSGAADDQRLAAGVADRVVTGWAAGESNPPGVCGAVLPAGLAAALPLSGVRRIGTEYSLNTASASYTARTAAGRTVTVHVEEWVTHNRRGPTSACVSSVRLG